MSATTELTEEKVLEALRSVMFPGLSRDIVSFGFIKDLTVGGGNVSFRLEIITESPRAAEEIKRDATEKLRSLPGVSAVTIRLDVQQPGPMPPRGAAGVPPASPSILQDVRFKIAVASGKGGVGKSTVAANLALALQRLGHGVGLMDSDIYGPSQQMMMGIDEKPFVNPENQIVPIERYGVKVRGAVAKIGLGRALVASGQLDDVVRLLHEGYSEWATFGGTFWCTQRAAEAAEARVAFSEARLMHSLARGGLGDQSRADPTSQRDKILLSQKLQEPPVPREDHRQERVGIEVGTGEDAQLAEDVGAHLLCFVNQEYRADP